MRTMKTWKERVQAREAREAAVRSTTLELEQGPVRVKIEPGGRYSVSSPGGERFELCFHRCDLLDALWAVSEGGRREICALLEIEPDDEDEHSQAYEFAVMVDGVTQDYDFPTFVHLEDEGYMPPAVLDVVRYAYAEEVGGLLRPI